MKKNVAFTICAKNYLAQALTLKESFLRYNNIPFFIFLSDAADVDGLPDVIELDNSWIPDWKIMAFKYNVIEFSTSIKPFCIKKLFDEGYERVMYLDPDIYICNNLDVVYSYLEKKSVVLTPHRCRICYTTDSLVREQHMSLVGIFNLGFIALKNDETGMSVVEWWKDKLKDKCMDDSSLGLFVDQKWIDFLPGYFPNEIYVATHLGMNVATWNLQERNVITEGGVYHIKDKFSSKKYELLFFHFSSYSPLIPNLLDKRKKESSLELYPSLKALVEEYRKNELKNGYKTFSTTKYSFNYFTNGVRITDFIRKLYNIRKDLFISKGDPFDSNGYFYSLLVNRKLISVDSSTKPSKSWTIEKMNTTGVSGLLFYMLLKWKGFDFYQRVLTIMKDLADIRYQKFLVE